jgi:hypothetical protein
MNNNKKQKYLLICEQSNSKLNRVDNEKYVFEGTFTEFGVENNNARIYEENDYLPHLEYLNKKIEKNMLVGELDHPEKFDISFAKASHIIEKLEYNKEKRQIIGRIRLLDTRAGNDAKALVDGGVQLSISSRAAGVVKENKKVSLKRIFTYDLVNDPGFDSANLTRVTESFGLSDDSSIQLFEFSNDKYTEENEKVLNDGMEINNEIQPIAEDNSSFVTNQKLQAYSKIISEKFVELEQLISEKDNKINQLELKIEEHNNYLAEEIKLNVGYMNIIAEHTNNLVGFTNKIVTNQRNIKDYIDKSTEKVNELVIENSNTVNYMNLTMEKIQESTLFAEQIAEEVQIISEHSEQLSEGLNTVAKFTEYLRAEGMEKTIDFIEHIAEEVKIISEGKIATMEVIQPPVNESKNISVKENINIISQIDEILETVKKQETARITENIGFAYFNLLGRENQQVFLELQQNQKQQVVEAINKQKPVSETEFVQIWESTLNPMKADSIVDILTQNMPTEYQTVWASMNEDYKNKIVAQSQFYNLNNPAAIKNFWQTRKELNEAVELQLLEKNTDTQKSINESQQYDPSLVLGYGVEHMNYIKSALDKKFSVR